MEGFGQYNIYVVLNPLTIPFTVYWDSQPYTIQPGKEMVVPEFLARHIASKLTDVIMQTQYGPGKVYNKTLRAPIMDDLLRLVNNADPGDLRSDGEKLAERVRKYNETPAALPPRSAESNKNPRRYMPVDPNNPLTNGATNREVASLPQVDVDETERAGFVNMNEESTSDVADIGDEQSLREQAAAENYPKAARASELASMDYSSLQNQARELGIRVNQKAEVLAAEILSAESK